MSQQKVKLDVGGVFYTTSLQTLSVEGSYFAALFSGNWDEEKDENDRIFIDRDGRAFEYVLDFMRNGSRMVFPESAEMRDRIRREADFYILPDLAELLKTDLVKLDVGGIHYTCSIETLSKSPYFTSLLSGDLSSKKDESGRIFIDRDGKAFEYVLDFMRNGSRMVLPESAEMRDRVCREAEFYQLAVLENLLMESMTMNLRIRYDDSNFGSESYYHAYYDVSVNLRRLKMYPGNWFEKAKEMLLQDDRGYYLLDRGPNFIASAIVAEYVGSSEREVIKCFSNRRRVSHYTFDCEGILIAVAFFGFPQALGQEIIAHWNRMHGIPELSVYVTQTHL